MQTIAALPLNVIPVGPFGRAVARHLKAFEPGMVEMEISDGEMPALEECRGMSVVASWRPTSTLCDYLCRYSRKANVPFIPLTLEGSALRLGPIILPGEGGCWLCWTKRSAQHAASPDEQAAVLEYYSSHRHAGPQGYLEPFARLGATKLKQTIDALRSSTAMGGCIWQIDVITRQISTGTVVGIHNCPRCGLQREGPKRSIDDMQRHLTAWRESAARRGCGRP